MSAWQRQASCRNSDGAIFFLDEPSKYSKKEYRNFCGSCPVKALCLEEALVYNYSGIWGGLTDKERNFKYSESFVSALREDYEESGFLRL